jgi:hypothetical protein
MLATSMKPGTAPFDVTESPPDHRGIRAVLPAGLTSWGLSMVPGVAPAGETVASLKIGSFQWIGVWRFDGPDLVKG